MELEPSFDHVNPRELRRAGRRHEESAAGDRFRVCHFVFMLFSRTIDTRVTSMSEVKFWGAVRVEKVKSIPTNLQEKKFISPINDWLRQFIASGCKNKEGSNSKLSKGGGTNFVLWESCQRFQVDNRNLVCGKVCFQGQQAVPVPASGVCSDFGLIQGSDR